MTSAIILINTESGIESRIIEELGAVSEVDAAYLVYDIVIKTTTESIEALNSFLIQKVRSLRGVRSALTLLMSRTY